MSSKNAEGLIRQLQEKFEHTSSVSQLLAPLSTRIEEEKISGICDALSISFLRTQAKRQAFPDNNESYDKLKLDELVRYQCIHSSDQQAAAKHVLREIGLRWFSNAADKNTVQSCNVTESGFVKLVSAHLKHMAGIVETLKKEKTDDGIALPVGISDIYAMLYFKRPGSKGDHNCSAIFSPDGQVHYFDPNVGAFIFESIKSCGQFVQLTANKLRYGEKLEALFFFDRIPLFKIPGFSTMDPLLNFKNWSKGKN